jgi:universal stress protein A
VLALDLDDAAPRALALALRLFRPPRPGLALVHAYAEEVQDLPYDADPSLVAELAELRRAERVAATHRVAQLLAGARALAGDERLPWTPVLRAGTPKQVVTRELASRRADLLIVGTRAMSGISHAFLGTVSGDLLRNATCDVLVVPPPRSPRARAARP